MTTEKSEPATDPAHEEMLARIIQAINNTGQGYRNTILDLASILFTTPKELTASLEGKRSLDSAEIARIADYLNLDVVWILSGAPDAWKPEMIAHSSHPAITTADNIPGDITADAVDIVLFGYAQSGQWYPETQPRTIPTDPATCRDLLTRNNPDRIFSPENLSPVFGAETITMPGVRSDSVFLFKGTPVFVTSPRTAWWESSLLFAHSLAAAALKQFPNPAHMSPQGWIETYQTAHSSYLTPDFGSPATAAYAAELILPAETMQNIDWGALPINKIAEFVWSNEISVPYLLQRMNTLDIKIPAILTALPQQGSTAGLFRACKNKEATTRYQESSERIVPEKLLEAHLEGTRSKKLNPSYLSWMLQEEIPTETEPATPFTADQLLELLDNQ